MSVARQRLFEMVPIFLLAISVLIFFGKVILTGRALFGSDYVLYFYPVKKFVRDYVLVHGTLPLWNPYQFSGTPLIANIQASVFYPFGFLFYLIPAEYAYGFTIVFHCILGILFMYAFVRSLSVDKWGAFLAAIIFTYNGFFMAHLYAGHLSFVQNYVWIPLIFCFFYKFLKTRSFGWAVFAGLFLGIQILGGFPQIAFYTILGLLAFGILHIGVSIRVRNIDNALRIFIGSVVVVSAGFAIAAIQILPTLEFVRLSTRARGVSCWFATIDSLHPKMFLSFLIPDIFGNTVDQTYWLSPRDWYFWETCGYVGVFPLCLIFASTSSARDLRNIQRFFAGLILLALFLSLGKYNPLYPLFYRLPGFHSLRVPAQILFLYVFGVAVLSGISLQNAEESLTFKKGLREFLIIAGIILLLFTLTMHLFPYKFFFYLFKTFAEEPIDPACVQRIPEKIVFSVNRSALLFLVSVVLLILFHKKKISKTLFKIAVLAMVMVDMGLYSLQFIKPYRFTTSEEKQALIDRIRYDTGPGRVLISKSIFLPNDGLLYRFPCIGGYDPLILKRYILYLEASQGLPAEKHVVTSSFISDHNHRFLKMLNLRYVVEGKHIAVLDTYLPRAILVRKAVVRPSNEILDFMTSDEFDPLKMVVLEPRYQEFVLMEKDEEDFEGSCSIIYYDNESIRVRTSANQSCYLVLSEIFYPGWKAEVDGREVPILCGNYLFRVIPLEHGRHEIELRFVSRSFRIGGIISLLTLVCSLWFIIWGRKRVFRRGARGEE